MEVAGDMSTDARGWIMSIVSGLACILGGSIIYIDVIVRLIPGKKNFRIEDSKKFMGASLSLSFGVMMFSALYSMLPSSKKYLIKDGYSENTAAWILLACFSAGFCGIQLFQHIMHHWIPSHVVGCDHKDSPSNSKNVSPRASALTLNHHKNGHGENHHTQSHNQQRENIPSESTPLLAPSHPGNSKNNQHGSSVAFAKNGNAPVPLNSGPSSHTIKSDGRPTSRHGATAGDTSINRRPSGPQRQLSRLVDTLVVPQRVMSFVLDIKKDCDGDGPCYGYTEPCGHSCFHGFTNIHTPTPTRANTFHRTPTSTSSVRPPFHMPPSHTTHSSSCSTCSEASNLDEPSEPTDPEAQPPHHHHVHAAKDAFKSMGLQTAIAIALHKLPEGFMTYSTNHANPSLGFSVFLALFVHNISEGFVLALTLYLSVRSRLKALLYSSILGGISQPLGAGLAAIWFKIQGGRDGQLNYGVYGAMFAVTSGIMVSVALVLYAEALDVRHHRNLCVVFAFLGMVLMGGTGALTAGKGRD